MWDDLDDEWETDMDLDEAVLDMEPDEPECQVCGEDAVVTQSFGTAFCASCARDYAG